jgi:hypothetical protein
VDQVGTHMHCGHVLVLAPQPSLAASACGATLAGPTHQQMQSQLPWPNSLKHASCSNQCPSHPF